MKAQYFFVKEKHHRPWGEEETYQVYKMKDLGGWERKLEVSKYGCENEKQAIVEIKKWMKQDGVV